MRIAWKKIYMKKPWTTWLEELLIHGLEHLEKKTDFDKRMALICIDNSVEIMLKTFLELPEKSNGIKGLSKKDKEEISRSFPSLLEGFEKFAEDKLDGIALDEIEFFHGLRNQLYHGGNGLTVDTRHVETYGAMAKLLLYNLFKIKVTPAKQGEHSRLVGEFIMGWRDLVLLFEGKFKNDVNAERWDPRKYIDWLHQNKKIDQETERELRHVHNFRNQLVHGPENPTENNLKELIDKMTGLSNIIKEIE